MTRILAILAAIVVLLLVTRRRPEVARPDVPCPRCGEWCGVTWPDSVGFVSADDERGVVLAASINGAHATGVTIIPTRQIIKRKRLR